jgi:hypothetical protein
MTEKYKRHIQKRFYISLDKESLDDNGYIEAVIDNDGSYSDGYFTLSFKDTHMAGVPEDFNEIHIEEMPIPVAIALRDFLNYAIPPNAKY